MEARTVDATGAGPAAPAHTPAPGRAARRSKAGGWLRGAGAEERAGAAQVEELEAELALLREENARLKIQGARSGARPWQGRVQDRVAPPVGGGDTAEQAWELMTECQLLRTALVDACRGLDAALLRMRSRLDAVAAPPGAQETEEEAGADDDPRRPDVADSIDEVHARES